MMLILKRVMIKSYNLIRNIILEYKIKRYNYILNSKEPLNIITYQEGQNQPTHPSVKYFTNRWNGYKYWMAYTPFPYNDDSYENPCITYSDDGYNWSEKGISNPIENTPMENGTKVGYNSDTHLVIVNDILECWWRTHYQNGENSDHEVIYRKKSIDGINWSEKEELYRVKDKKAGSLLSPVVIYEAGKYMIWVCYKQQVLRYYESIDGYDWQYIRDINVDNPDFSTYKIWHFDIIKTDIGYEFVGCYHPTTNYDDNRFIYYAYSKDNITYSKRKLILTKGDKGSYAEEELYRPSIVKRDNGYMIYYGCKNHDRNWKIAMVEIKNEMKF